MKTSKKGMKVTYFQNNFSKYQLRPYSLRFRNAVLEKQYQEDRLIDGKALNFLAVVVIIVTSIAGCIQVGYEQKISSLVILALNAILHCFALFQIKQDLKYLKNLLFLLNLYSTVCYSIFLSSIVKKLTIGQLIFIEDIYVYSLLLFMRTNTFIWDLMFILSSRIIILVFSVVSIDNSQQQWQEVTIAVILCILSGVLSIFNLFKNEKLRRETFLNLKQKDQWNVIVDEVLPINIIISKYNSITGEISLNASNQEAQSNFKIQNDESFNQFMQKIRLDIPNSKKTLRDFILEKHHAIAKEIKVRQDMNIKPLIQQTRKINNNNFNNDLKSLQEHDSPFDDLDSNSPSKVDRNPSIKKMVTSRSIVKKRPSVKYDQGQKFVEILKGYYCEDWENKPFTKCQYKIQVFQFSVNEPLLLINVENNQEQEVIKMLKVTRRQYRDLFKDTLYFFQDRIVRLSTEIGQVAIPLSQSNLYYDLKYSLMSIFTGIHNILDFVFEKGNSYKEKEQAKDQNNTNKKELNSGKPKKKDSFYQQLSPQNSIENELQIIENGQYSFHGNPSSSQTNNNQPNSNLNNKNSSNPKMGVGQNPQQNLLNNSTMGNTKIRNFSLRKLLNEVSDVMFEKCKQKKVMFFFSDLLGEEYQMIQDQRRIKQVLFNYLQNALDCVQKGYISLTVKPYMNLGFKTFRFEIMDSGPGVNDNIIADEQYNNNNNMNNSSHNGHIQVVSLRKKSQNHQKQLRKLSSFSNYFQNITTANPQSKQKGLGIGMKVNQKIIAKLGPYFPKIYSEQETGTRIIYEMYADILAIRNLKQKYRASIHRDFREEDVPEEEEFIGLSCYKYTRNEIYHFSKNSKSSNLLLSPDSALYLQNLNEKQQNLQNQNQGSNQQNQIYLNSNSNNIPSVIQSMINLNTPIIIPSNFSTIPNDNFNQSMPIRTPSSLIQVEPNQSRHRPESLENALSMKVTRSNQIAISNTQMNNSFTLESFRSRDRSRQDSFFVDMNNRKRLLNQNNQLQLNLNGSDDGNNVFQNPALYNGSLTNPNNHNYNPNIFHPYKKYSLHDLSNYS
ncbi:hypothetical protein ABPG74_001684 [Tetrahymena malaccensis]